MNDETLEAIWGATALSDARVLAFGRAVAAEVGKQHAALIEALKTHAGDSCGWEFGLGRVRFDTHGRPAEFLWATQAEIDAAIQTAMLAAAPSQPAQGDA